MKFGRFIFLFSFLLMVKSISAQEHTDNPKQGVAQPESPAQASSPKQKEKNWTLSGYHKSLNGLFGFRDILTGKKTILSDAFLHNRLNFRWFPNEHWTLRAELRNRFFYGELSRNGLFGDFKEGLKQGNDVLNMQLLNVGDKVVFHSIFDRLYLDYTKDNLEIRLGRQRINWGINTVWNPHDIFNAFSFTDFDYEERPGSDALRIKYYTGFANSIEVAIKAFDDPEEIVGGLLWKVNKWNYDFQFLGGWSFHDVVLGFGWAGAIKNMGFKGEASYFKSTVTNIDDTFAGTLSVDYSFKKGAFLASGLLYNGSKNVNPNLFAFDLSARNLYPYQWAVFASISQPFTPIFNGSLALIWSPVDGQPLFVNPTLTYSLSQNVDVDLVGQILLQGIADEYKSFSQVAFLRIKWSF